MTVGEITRELNLTPLTKGDPDAPVLGGCCCDLLSWVMAQGVHQGAWITVQTHMNTIAVATLLDLSCLIIPESIPVEEDVLNKAEEEGIAVLQSPMTAYEICGRLYRLGIGASART